MTESVKYQIIETHKGKVGYINLGQGQPLILIVGYSGTLYHWNRFFINELARHFSVYLIDNRLIGQSNSNNEYSMLGLAQDVVDFITAKKMVKPLVFGWSMGGIITQTILKNYNGLLGGVALLGTIPHASYISQNFINLLANSDKLHPNEFRTQLYGMFFSATPSPELKDFITSAALNIEDYHYRFNFEAKELQDYAVVSWPGMDLVALNEIDVPSLILHAKNDLVIAPEACQILAREIPDSKLIIYSSGGHFFLHRNPIMIARDVCNFFLCQAG